MECREVDSSVELGLDGESGPVEQAELEAHLSICAGCRSRVDAHERFRVKIRSKLREAGSPSAPIHLKTCVVSSLRQADESRRGAPWGLVAVVALGLPGFVIVKWRGEQLPPLDPEPTVIFHSKNLPPEVVVRRDHQDVERFVRQNLAGGISLPRAGMPEVRLVGARLSQINNREAVQVMYDQRGARISLFAYPQPNKSSPPLGFDVREVAGRPLLVGRHRGYSVVSWYEGEKDVLYSLVSDVDKEELIRLASGLDR